MKKRLLDFILVVSCVCIAVLVGFYIVPRDNKHTRETSMVVQLRNDLGKNQMIKDSDLELVEKGSYGLARDTIMDKAEVIGMYAKTELPRGIVLQEVFFQNEKEPVNAFLYENPEMDGISFDTNLTRSVAGIAEKGDFVRAIIYLKPENSGMDSRVLMLDELSNLEIISISNNRGKSLEEEDKGSSDYAIPAVVTVKANKQQQAMLVKYMNDGIIHLSLRPRILALGEGTDAVTDILNMDNAFREADQAQAESEIITNANNNEASDGMEAKGKGFGIN